MKDFLGNELKVGDKVLIPVLQDYGAWANFDYVTIIRFHDNWYTEEGTYETVAEVDFHCIIRSCQMILAKNILNRF